MINRIDSGMSLLINVGALSYRYNVNADYVPIWTSSGQLELMCTVTGSFLEWRFTVVRGNETIATEFSRIILSTESASAVMSHLIINSTMFTFSRTSAENSLPLHDV